MFVLAKLIFLLSNIGLGSCMIPFKITFITEFERLNTTPIIIEKLNIPTKPPLPQKYNKGDYIYIYEKDGVIYEFLKKAKQIKYIGISMMFYLDPVDKINEYKVENILIFI